MNTDTKPTLEALRYALEAVRAFKARIKPNARTLPADFDGVEVAGVMSDHAAGIIAAERAFYGNQSHISSEAGFLAGYWMTTALLMETMNEAKANRVWFCHAEDWLVDEIKSNGGEA